MKNIAYRILRNAETDPSAAAIENRGRTQSYGALRSAAFQAARLLAERGVMPGDRLGLCLRDTEETIVAMVGAWLRGVTVLLIDFRTAPETLARIANDNEIALLVSTGAPASTPSTTSPSWLSAADWAALRAAGSAEPVAPVAEPGPAFRSLTSGTSGSAAAFDLSHAAGLFRAQSVYQTGIGAAYRRYLCTGPLSYGAQQGWVMNTLINGGTVVLFPAVFRPQDLAAALERLDISCVALVPAALRDLLELRRGETGWLGAPDRPPILVATGARTDGTELAQALDRLSPNVLQWYAASPVGAVAGFNVGDRRDKITSLGRPIPGVEVEIIGIDGALAAPGEIGRIRVRTPGMADRIIGRDKASGGDYLEDGWYYSGDLCSMDEDGYLYFEGRAGDVIDRAGVTIYPREIEVAIALHPGVRDVAAVGFAEPRVGQEIGVFVVAAEGVTEADIEAHAKAVLSADRRPRLIRVVPSLPLNDNGKVMRRKLVLELEKKKG